MKVCQDNQLQAHTLHNEA